MKLVLMAIAASLTLAGCATGPQDQDHAAHHPAVDTSGATPPGDPSPGQMDSMMKSMQEMHARMMAAASAQERARLMQEHMKLMQDGIGMMGHMRHGAGISHGMGTSGGAMPMSPEMMARRMDMMEMMMQMMLDRDAMKPPADR